MKLFIYELKKILNKKIFFVVLLLCLAINGFLLYSSQNTEENSIRITYSNEYTKMLNSYSSMSLNDAEKQIDNELLAYEIFSRLENLAQTDNEELIENYTYELDEYRKSNPDAYQKAVEMSEKGGDNFWKNSFLYNISQQIEYINSYPDFIDKMYDRAKAQSSSSIFGDESSFSYKNLYKTSNDYSGLKNTKLSLVNSDAFIATTEYSLTDIFIIAIVFLLCVYLFQYEREKGLYSLVRCTKFGRFKTIISKFMLFFVLSAVVSILFIFCNFIINFRVSQLYPYSYSRSIFDFVCICKNNGDFCYFIVFGSCIYYLFKFCNDVSYRARNNWCRVFALYLDWTELFFEPFKVH